jgi:hypothetical protein
MSLCLKREGGTTFLLLPSFASVITTDEKATSIRKMWNFYLHEQESRHSLNLFPGLASEIIPALLSLWKKVGSLCQKEMKGQLFPHPFL